MAYMAEWAPASFWRSQQGPRFADSPLEEAGFELLVPIDIDAARAGQMTGNPSGKSAANLESRLRRSLTNSKAPLPSALVFERVSGRDRCSTAGGLTHRGSPTGAHSSPRA